MILHAVCFGVVARDLGVDVVGIARFGSFGVLRLAALTVGAVGVEFVLACTLGRFGAGSARRVFVAGEDEEYGTEGGEAGCYYDDGRFDRGHDLDALGGVWEPGEVSVFHKRRGVRRKARTGIVCAILELGKGGTFVHADCCSTVELLARSPIVAKAS